MKKIAILTILLFSTLFANFKTIDENQVIEMTKKGIPLIDIRTKQEWKDRGVIKGAKLITFFNEKGQPEVANFMFELGSLIQNRDKPFIIYCAHANRSKRVGKWLSDVMGFKNVYELKGGIEYGWINKGKSVEKVK